MNFYYISTGNWNLYGQKDTKINKSRTFIAITQKLYKTLIGTEPLNFANLTGYSQCTCELDQTSVRKFRLNQTTWAMLTIHGFIVFYTNATRYIFL